MPKGCRIALNALALLLILSSKSFADPVSGNADAPGKIEVTEHTFDFGFMPQNAVFSHIFQVRNVGQGTLNIVKVEPTCGCTSVPLNKAFLKAGEKTDIRVNFDSGKFQGGIHKRIKVLSTDPQNGLVELFIHGVVGKPPEAVELIGPMMNFDKIGIVSREIRVKNLSMQKIILTVLPLVDGFFEAVVSPQKIEPQAEATLTVTLKETPPLGEFKSSVTVESTGDKVERFSIPIAGIGYAR